MKKWFVFLVFLGVSSELLALDYRPFSFSELSKTLGYPDPTFFGSNTQEIFDLETYTNKDDPCYQEINGYLRFYPAPYEWYGTGPEDAKKIVKSMDNIFRRVPTLPQNLILYRGLSLNFRKNKSFQPGEEFIDLGFVSTSTDFKVAHHFAVGMNSDQPQKKKAIFIMYLDSSGHRGILIDQEEDEVILKRGQKMKVMASKTKKNQEYESYLVQVCSTLCQDTLNGDILKFWNRHP